jgi:hypothetical protein
MAAKLYVFTLIVTLCSCGGFGFAVKEHLTDDFYLIAVDTREELGVSYRTSENGYSQWVGAKVVSVDYNNNFIIVKQQPTDTDTTLYYIIDIDYVKKEREKYASRIDTVPPRYFFFPIENPVPLTFEGFMSKRKELNVPDSLNFAE